MSYLTVVGLVEGYHVIEDIGYRVPKGVSVSIPVDLCNQSKDLWVALSQKRVLQVSTSYTVPPNATVDELSQKCSRLSEEVLHLQTQNDTLRLSLAGYQNQVKELQDHLNKVNLPNGLKYLEDSKKDTTEESSVGLKSKKTKRQP